jgi:hypothetical protein
MIELICLYLVTKFLMAVETEVLARFQQVVLVICGMRVVAQDAFAFGHYLVGAFGVFGNKCVVTFVTDALLVPIKETGVFRGMGIMAAGAFTLGKRGMDGSLFQDTLKVCMAFKAQLAPGSRVQMQDSILALAGARLCAMAGSAGTLGKGRVQHGFEELRIL